MPRRYESQYYSSEGMRHIQAQINELWAVIDRRLVDVEPAITASDVEGRLHQESAAGPVATEYLGPNAVSGFIAPPVEFAGPMPYKHTARERLEMAKNDRLKGVPLIHVLTTDEDEKEISWEEYVAGMEQEIAVEEGVVHNPQPFKVIHCGNGWYQVADSEGKPIDVRKMRKEPAEAACRVAMEGA